MQLKKLTYEYTSESQLIKPHRYFYTPFYGHDFFQTYFADRKKYIADGHQYFLSATNWPAASQVYELIARISSHQFEKKLFDEFSFFSDEFEKGELEFDTLVIFNSILNGLFNGEIQGGLINYLEFYVKRYEVNKRIFERYDLASNPIGVGSSESVELYCVFSILLTLVYLKIPKIRYLNTLLKVNDLLSSVMATDNNAISQVFLGEVFSSEVKFVLEIAHRLKIHDIITE